MVHIANQLIRTDPGRVGATGNTDDNPGEDTTINYVANEQIATITFYR